jgi:hypothetical protein
VSRAKQNDFRPSSIFPNECAKPRSVRVARIRSQVALGKLARLGVPAELMQGFDAQHACFAIQHARLRQPVEGI